MLSVSGDVGKWFWLVFGAGWSLDLASLWSLRVYGANLSEKGVGLWSGLDVASRCVCGLCLLACCVGC
jgi:hypothetical protein